MDFDRLQRYWWISFASVLLFLAILYIDHRYDAVTMLRLEFAPRQADFFRIISENGYSKGFLEKCLYLDFFFIASFTTLFFVSLIFVVQMRNKKLKLWRLAACLVPGALDVFEDSIMLHMVRHGAVKEPMYNLLQFVVYAKWILVLPWIGVVIYALYLQFQRFVDSYSKNIA